MQIVVEDIELNPPRVIQWDRVMTDDEYFHFCELNRKMRIERTPEGDIVIMPPGGLETGFRNSDLAGQLGNWAGKDGRGVAFASNTEYILPSRAAYAPDASWVLRSRLETLEEGEEQKFPHLCPDFVVELMSHSDRLNAAKRKMLHWMENGVRLGWLLDPERRTAYIYRPGREPEQIVNPENLAGEDPVDGFVLELASIWGGLRGLR